jgi:hypothetical protein
LLVKQLKKRKEIASRKAEKADVSLHDMKGFFVMQRPYKVLVMAM